MASPRVLPQPGLSPWGKDYETVHVPPYSDNHIPETIASLLMGVIAYGPLLVQRPLSSSGHRASDDVDLH